MATQVSLNDGAVASAGALAIQTNGTTQAVSISTGQVATLAQNPILTSGTANGVAYLNGSKVVTTGSALTFDGTNLGLGGTNNSYGSQTAMTLSGTNVSRIDFRSNSTFTGTILSYQAVTEGLRLQTEAGYPITFYPAGTKAATIDTAGNLGLGVTPSAWRTAGGEKAIQIGTSLTAYSNSGGDVYWNRNWFLNSSSQSIYLNNGFAQSYGMVSGEHRWYIAPSWNGTGSPIITFTQAMTLTADGNLGIGATSPGAKLQVDGTAGNTLIRINRTDSTSARGALQWTGSDGVVDWQIGTNMVASGGLEFSTGQTSNVLMTLETSGNLLVGTTTSASSRLCLEYTGGSLLGQNINDSDNTNNSTFVQFQIQGTQVGTIKRVGATSAVIYNTSSDYRLKTVVGAVTGQGERIDALKPINYLWKEGNTSARGFLAHEFQEVYASSVSGDKDAVDANGNPVYQAMQASTSEVIADLVAEIQSIRKRLAAAGI